MITATRCCLWLIALAALWLMPGITSAGVGFDPIVLTDGDFVTESKPVAAIGSSVALSITPTGLDDAAQVFSYMWQVSVDNGVNWRDWFGGVIVGGVYVDKLGNPKTTWTSKGPPRAHGPQRLRLRGHLTSTTSVTIVLSIGGDL